VVPETGIEPVRPLFTKRRILSPLCLPISPLRLKRFTALLNAPCKHPARRLTSYCQTKKPHGFADIYMKPPMKKDSILKCCPLYIGAGEESRTLDLNLGKVALYQLSYSRDNSLKL
jgi:hypothetical protein